MKIVRSIAIVLGVGVVLVVIAGAATAIKHSRETDTVSDAQKIARTLKIIRTSTPGNRAVLKVLFYGQSITGTGWPNFVVEYWRRKYPNVVFVVQNRALGGFDSRALERTAAQDIAAFYPDLIVFHVYGDHRAYERIVRIFRTQTAADVILQTDHGEVLPDPACAEGLALLSRGRAGCAGWVWVHQKMWSDEMSYHKIPALGKKYQVAVEPQRRWWRDYLLQRHVDPKSLLRDEIHPNERGKTLIAAFFNAYFDNLVASWNGQTEPDAVSVPPAVHSVGAEPDTVKFEGDRLELLSDRRIAVWPTVHIDGKSPEELGGCYQVSRASPIQTVPDWPAVRRIELGPRQVPQIWTAMLTQLSADQSQFRFRVTGSVTGDEGEGSSGQKFTSRSGQITIQPEDWMVRRAFEVTQARLITPYRVQWSINYVCGNQPEIIDKGDGTTQFRYIVGAGLSNGSHVATVQWSGEDPVATTGFLAYRPPLTP